MKKTLLASLMLMLVLLIAACGSSQKATPMPTVTPVPSYVYTVPTAVAAISTVAAATPALTQESVAVDPTDIAHGENRYTALGCDSCHGADGKGNGDKGPALVPMTLDETDFMTVLRTGGKLGNAHLFASNRLSDDFAHYLYEYLKSLS